jgi:hypothetical protein
MFGSVVVRLRDPGHWPEVARRLRAAALYPEAVTTDRDGGHRAAWRLAQVRAVPTLVVGDRVALVADWSVRAARAEGALAETPWHVSHLDGERMGEAYVVTPEGARLLGAQAADVAVEELAAGGDDLAVVAIDPPLAFPVDDDTGRLEAPATDLVRLFRYDGALPADASLTSRGDELVSLAFWPADFCRIVIEATEATAAWGADELDPVPGHEVSLATISPRLFAHVEDHVAAVVAPRLREHWPTLEFHGLRDAFVIRYTAGDTEGLRLHHDVAQVSGSARLNDGFTGGELVFPRQGTDNSTVPVGHLLLWPSLVTHPHAANPVRSGVKYGLTVWFEVPGLSLA